jgi:hypothetical protein
MKSRNFFSSSLPFVLNPEHKSKLSSMIPGPPLGIGPTNPSASAPYSIARQASSSDEIQHTLTLILFIRLLVRQYYRISIERWIKRQTQMKSFIAKKPLLFAIGITVLGGLVEFLAFFVGKLAGLPAS